MELIILILLGVLPLELTPDFSLVTPDDEEIYEVMEDSLRKREQGDSSHVREYRLLLRMRNDTIKPELKTMPVFLRLCGSEVGREMVLLLEKDKGERSLMDFIGGGISIKTGVWRFSFGDFLAGFGRGLILALPYERSGLNSSQFISESKSTLPKSAQENRNLRGARADLHLANLGVTFLGSYSLRDAILNPDGSVARLSFSGVHRDSATEAVRNQVGQFLSGVSLRYIKSSIFQGGVCAYSTIFTRSFSPKDSTVSFFGRNLGVGSIYFAINHSSKQLDLEVARSIPGGVAATANINVSEGGIKTRISGTVFQSRFFSPAGRKYNINQARSRLEVNGNIEYKKGALKLGISGNTYRDYFTDSVPARLLGSFEYNFGVPEIRVRLGRLYRMEMERSRFTDVEALINHRDMLFKLLLRDQYLDYSSGRGILLALAVKKKLNKGELSFNVARFLISGTNMTITVPESGSMRIESSYSSRTSAWRLSLAGGYRWSKFGRLGMKVGVVHHGSLLFDWATQLEAGGIVD